MFQFSIKQCKVSYRDLQNPTQEKQDKAKQNKSKDEKQEH